MYRGHRRSLLGPNGCGKSTLLRTIAAAAADATERGELSNTIAVNPRRRSVVKVPPLAVPQLGSCASSGCGSGLGSSALSG